MMRQDGLSIAEAVCFISGNIEPVDEEIKQALVERDQAVGSRYAMATLNTVGHALGQWSQRMMTNPQDIARYLQEPLFDKLQKEFPMVNLTVGLMLDLLDGIQEDSQKIQALLGVIRSMRCPVEIFARWPEDQIGAVKIPGFCEPF